MKIQAANLAGNIRTKTVSEIFVEFLEKICYYIINYGLHDMISKLVLMHPSPTK